MAEAQRVGIRASQPDPSAAAAATRPAPVRWRPPLGAPVAVAVIVAAWGVAVLAEVGGQGERLHHHALAEGTTPAWLTVGLFLVAWQVHVAAMMLPSSLPLIALFNRASAGQLRPHAARAAFLGGYLAVWTVFGLLALLGDAVVHQVVHHWSWLAHRPQVIGGGTLIVAGAFQFSPLKDRCLTQCRHPAAFLATHYQRGVRAAFAMGRRHGTFCLGCCWALMLVMFAVGITNLAWMAPLALLMVVEKAVPGGDLVVRPVGLALVALGAAVLLDPPWLPAIFPAPSH